MIKGVLCIVITRKKTMKNEDWKHFEKGLSKIESTTFGTRADPGNVDLTSNFTVVTYKI